MRTKLPFARLVKNVEPYDYIAININTWFSKNKNIL